MIVKLLMGHSLKALGVSAGYLSKGMLRDSLRKAQREISSEIFKRLGLGVWPIGCVSQRMVALME